MESSDPSASGPAPAGWYADPYTTRRQRYWDGSRWTDQIADTAGPVAPPAAAWPAPMSDADARQWAMLAHLSALAALVIGFPWVGPLVIYLVKRNDHPFVADQAREALNFNLSVFIYEIVAVVVTFLLIIVLIGLLLLPLLLVMLIAWIVLVIVAAMDANRGKAYRYPLTIRMVS